MVQFTERNLPSCCGRCASAAPLGGMRRTASTASRIGRGNMVFTSNKNPALWREDFNEDSTLLCALDRIFDEATVFKLRGESFRGKKLDTVSVQTGKVKAVELLADQQEE